MNNTYSKNISRKSIHKTSTEVTYTAPHILYPFPDFPLNNKYNLAIKRFIDIIVSITLIPTILSWLIPLLAIINQLDSCGPVFFLQKRNSKGGKLFTCIKLRTMLVNEDADLKPACINDKRITTFGKFLRRYHLDELPQLFNVLMGDMSIIGPRPYMVNENLYYEELLGSYSHRHSVKPGITGLAQSYGYFGSVHNIEKIKERIDLDILYIRKWSLRMDISILFRTLIMIAGFEVPDAGNKSSGLIKNYMNWEYQSTETASPK